MSDKNRYVQIIERIFAQHYKSGARRVDFTREEIERAAADLAIKLPKNLGDLIYTFRYRAALPESIRSKAPTGEDWIIVPAGQGKYRFEATTVSIIVPHDALVETRVPDATPGIIAKYALSDEQALLAKLRYNRLIDIFTGVTCYSLQSHLRTTVRDLGQVETDEVYIGLDKRGAHYAFPVQAKGGRDAINIVQIMQDLAMCREKFALLICRPIAAQFMQDGVIALFEFEETPSGFAISAEKHYRLVPPEQVTDSDLQAYAQRPG
ncbi:MAG: endonuclease [Planctomycetota bacterium]|nr:endonuclease [Planctomycetota bacterium]